MRKKNVPVQFIAHFGRFITQFGRFSQIFDCLQAKAQYFCGIILNVSSK